MMMGFPMKTQHNYLHKGLLAAMILFALAFSSRAHAATHIVTFECCQYTPDFFQAMVGDTVEWQGDFSFHPLESTTIPPGATPFSNSSGTTYSYVVEVPGTYNYHCVVHQPTMSGSFEAIEGLFGIKTIPGDYPTIAAAISDLNVQGVGTGGVTFNVAAGHTETAANLVIAVAIRQPTASNTVVFQKSGSGANPLITAAPGVSLSSDGIIKLSGADYITFDGIDLLDPPSNNTFTTMMEWGYALLRASTTDGSQHVTIKNCTITLQKANIQSSSVFSIGIFVANRDINGVTVNATDPAGLNSYNRLFGNAISNVVVGIRFLGPSTAGQRDFDNEVGVVGEAPNTITNFAGSGTTAQSEGIRIEGQMNVKVNNNIISGGIGHTYLMNGILVTTGGSNPGTGNYEIAYNTVTLLSSPSSYLQFAIRALANGDTVRIHHNVVENSNISASTTASFYGISHDPVGTPGSNLSVIHDNIVRNNTLGGTTGALVCIHAGGSGSMPNLFVYNNEIYGNQKTGSGSLYGIETEAVTVSCYSNMVYNNTGGATLYGYYNSASGVTGQTVYNNSFYNLSAATTTYGIYANTSSSSNTAPKTFYDNTVYGVSSTSGTAVGIYHRYGGVSLYYRNDIYNVSTAAADTSNFAAGIVVYNVLSTSSSTVYNNFISDIRAPNSGNRNGVIGINGIGSSSGSSASVFYNTIYLNASSSGTNFGSSGISFVGSATATNATHDLRNNIVVNLSAPNGTGVTTALRRITNTSLNNYSLNSNNNCWYAGTPSASRLIYYDGTNSDQTLADFQTRVAPRESASVSELPPFVNTTTPPYNLHIDSSTATAVDSGAMPIAGITQDYDGDTRDATYPDIGADEFTAGAGTVTVNVPVSVNWNLVSLPVSNPVPDDSVSHLFVNSANPYAFVFVPGSGYAIRYTMENGPGYWIKSTATYVQDITGLPRPCPDSITVQPGWNMIGSVHCTIDTGLVVTDPPGIRASNFFGYSNGYVVATQIVPGRGYWVKASASGWIILCCSSARAMEGNSGKKFDEGQKLRLR
jgi:plastocyanin